MMGAKRWGGGCGGWLLSALLLPASSCSLIVDPSPVVETDGGGDADADADADVDADGEVPPSCGNRTVDPGEDCDDGNDTPDDGCEDDCRFSCRAAGECDDDDPCTTDFCTVVSGGQACRHAVAPGVACDDGAACTHTDRCNADGGCTGTTYTCEAGPCEDASTCDGTGTCAVTWSPSGTECRASRGVCDLAETCTGSSSTCPADLRRLAGFVCRAVPPPDNQCNPPEACDGSSDHCPPDDTLPDGRRCDDLCCGCGGNDFCRGGVCQDGSCRDVHGLAVCLGFSGETAWRCPPGDCRLCPCVDVQRIDGWAEPCTSCTACPPPP